MHLLTTKNMPVCAVKKKYHELSESIFKPSITRFLGGNIIKPLFNRPWFSGLKLETAIQDVIGGIEDLPMRHEQNRCQM